VRTGYEGKERGAYFAKERPASGELQKERRIKGEKKEELGRKGAWPFQKKTEKKKIKSDRKGGEAFNLGRGTKQGLRGRMGTMVLRMRR